MTFDVGLWSLNINCTRAVRRASSRAGSWPHTCPRGRGRTVNFQNHQPTGTLGHPFARSLLRSLCKIIPQTSPAIRGREYIDLGNREAEIQQGMDTAVDKPQWADHQPE